MASPPDHHAPRHPIQVVARRTGLSPDLLRAWEQRFGLVAPSRSESGRRLYSDADVERLRLLQRVTREGWSIGRIASLPNDELHALLDDRPAAAPAPEERAPARVDVFLSAALEAVSRYDATALDSHLWRAVVSLPPADFFDRVLTPLLVEIGERWRRGQLQPAGEHIATAVIRRILGRIGDWQCGQFTFRMLVMLSKLKTENEDRVLPSSADLSRSRRMRDLGDRMPRLTR